MTFYWKLNHYLIQNLPTAGEALSKPSSPPREAQHDSRHGTEQKKVGILVMQFGNVFESHAVDSSHER
jgi:hypothetical protein